MHDKARKRQWIEENREAIDGWIAWVAEYGLPLAIYRQFACEPPEAPDRPNPTR